MPTDITQFIGKSQWLAIRSGMRGEEREFFTSKVKEITGIIEAMPKTGDPDSDTAYLHDFAGGSANWWITEKDIDDDGKGQWLRQYNADGMEARLGWYGNLYSDYPGASVVGSVAALNA